MVDSSVEIWKNCDFVGFPNYEVSNLGNVRSLDRVSIRRGTKTNLKGFELKKRDVRGYYRVVLYSGDRASHKAFSVHRLVALAFVDNEHNFPYVNHKDENRKNNRSDNLEWCTAKYNSNYGTAINRRVLHQDWNSIAKKQAIPVDQYDKSGNLVHRWESMMECERQTGFRCSSVSRCCKGMLKTYGGYVWKKASE